MTTITDVARRAGVGIATVSRVMNETDNVSQETREKVLAAMRELQYRPNEIARSLKRKHTRSIALALTDISNPFFGEVAQAVELAVRERGYTVLFCSTGANANQEAEAIDLLLEKQVDGIIWWAPHNEARLKEVAAAGKPPVVIITPMAAHRAYNGVFIDDARGAFEAVAHLIRLGHRRIAYIAEPDTPDTSQERMRGYRLALQENAIPLNESLVVRGTYREGSGSRAADVFLSQAQRPTAIFAANDLMAIEAMTRLRSLGVRVPQEMAIVGFDDIKMAGLPGIDLTTVSQPKQAMGSEAARLLIAKLQHQESIDQIILSPHLVIRQTCGYILNRAQGE